MSQIENRSTYLFSLNINNEEWVYRLWTNRAMDLIEENDNDQNAAKHDLAKEMRDYYRHDENPLADYCMVYSDLLGWALDCVDWTHAAESFIEDAAQRLDLDEE